MPSARSANFVLQISVRHRDLEATNRVLDILLELTAILQGHTGIAAGAAMPDLAIATESKGSGAL